MRGNFNDLRSRSVIAVIGISLLPIAYGLLLSFKPERGPHINDLALHYPWLRWDSFHYLSIAEHGYKASLCGEFVCGNTAWFPLYPFLVRLLSLVAPPQYAALGISILSFVGLVFAWKNLVGSRWTAIAISLLFLTVPSGFYLVAAFPVSLVLLLQAMALINLLMEKQFNSWLFAFLSGLTYPPSVLFCVGILPFFFKKKTLKSVSEGIKAAAVLTSPLQGYIFARWLIQFQSGLDNAYQLTVMRYGFNLSYQFSVLRSSIRYFFQSPIYLQTLIVFVMTVFSLVYLCFRFGRTLSPLDLSVMLTGFFVWFPPHLYGDAISIYRQEAMLAPLFVYVISKMRYSAALVIGLLLAINSLSMAALFYRAVLV